MIGTDKDVALKTNLYRTQGNFYDSKESWRRKNITETLYDAKEGTHR